jgi:archaellum biogenesis protein FlaJ (TadC family)
MTKKIKKNNQLSILLIIGYIVFKDLPAKILPKSKWVKAKLESAGIRISYIVYMSAILFWTIIISVLIFIFIPYCIDLTSFSLILSTLLDTPYLLLDPQLIRLIVSLIGGVTTVIVFYTYPLYVSGKVKRELERNLVYITNYMAIMESGGATSEEVFTSLAKVGNVFGIAQSGETVMRSVDLLGQDIIVAMDKESKRTPSREYGSFLQGFIATVRKGGDLRAYLSSMSEKHVEDRKRLLTKLVTQMNFVAEVFIIALVAFPIIMIVLLTVMESLGGKVLGDLSGMQLMNLMTYAIVPFAAIGIVFLIDIISGKE